MANKNDTQEKLRTGIEAARNGNKIIARELLRQVVTAEPNNELAWMWLASAVDTLRERRECLEKALEINPGNTRAKEALLRLGDLGRDQPSPARPAQQGMPAPQPLQRARTREEKDREAIDALRRRQTTSQRRSGGFSFGTPLIALGVVLLVAALAFVIINVVSNRAVILPGSNPGVAVVPSATPGPRVVTTTPRPLFVVTINPNEALLPPTFTPTFTPTATETPLPTATPIPINVYRLAYTSRSAGGEQPVLITAAGDGANPQIFGSAEAGFEDIAYDPAGLRIAFVRRVTYTVGEGDAAEERTTPELFVASATNPDDAVQLTQIGGTLLSDPTWSPDGIQLFFVSNYDGDEELWTLTEDGNNLRQITFNTSADRDPAWSPDGTTILFASDVQSPGQTEIYSMLPDGTNITRLTDDAGNSANPAWSPNGASVAFDSDRAGDSDIYVMDPNGARPFLVTVFDNEGEDFAPSFSPDGRWIAFSSNRSSDNFQIFAAEVAGDEVIQISDNNQTNSVPDFVPQRLFP